MLIGLSNRADAVSVTWRRASSGLSEDRSLRAAERNAAAAAARYRALRVTAGEAGTCAEGRALRRRLSTWQQLLMVVVGGGLLSGSLVIWLLATAYVGPVALLLLSSIAGPVAGFLVLWWRRPPAPRVRRRPVVADLVRAAQEVQDAEAALQYARARQRATQDRPVRARPQPGAAELPRDRVPWPRSRRGARQA